MVKTDGDSHVGAHRRVGVCGVDVVVEVAVVVEEGGDERLLGFGGGLDPAGAGLGQVGQLLGEVGGKHQGVVPQGVQLHQQAGAGHHGASTPH